MQAAPVVRASPAPAPFADILDPEVNVWTLQRRFVPAEARALERVAAGPAFEWNGRVDVARPDPTELLAEVHDPLARELLARDIASLVRAFGALLQRRHLHASLGVVRHDACRKLHADHVTVRLLCTYAGRGTEWVPNEDAVRANLGRIDVDFDTANRSVLRRPDALRRCEAGDVILLKGDAFQGNRGRGAVHRSPPIEADGLSRLVFKLDEHRCGC